MTAAWIVAGLVALWAVVATALTVILAIALKDAEDRIEDLGDRLECALVKIDSSVESRVARFWNRINNRLEVQA